MKQNKGVTLIALTIYIIVLIITVGVLTSIIGYFMKNLDEITVTENSEELFSRLVTFINSDLNNDDLIYIKSGKDSVISREYLLLRFNNKEEHIYLVQNGQLFYLCNENFDIEKTSYDKEISLCKEVTAKDNIDIFNYANNRLDINIKILGRDFAITLYKTL